MKMDIYLLSYLTFFMLSLLFMSYQFKAPYLSVFAGILMILLGIGLSVDHAVTKCFCDYDQTSQTIVCANQSLPSFSFWDKASIAIGGIMMFLGVGVMLDTLVRVGEAS